MNATVEDPIKGAANHQGNPQTPPPPPPKGAATVVIGCKLPHGLIIEVGIDKNGNKSERYQSIKLNGPNRDGNRIIGNAYGFTHVDKALWELWVKTHADLPYVKKELVFVQADLSRAEAASIERGNERHGLESLQDKDARLGKNVGRQVEEDRTARTRGPVVANPVIAGN